MNDDDYKDISIWDEFFVTHVEYFSNAVLEQMVADLSEEKKEREIENK